MCEFWTWNVPYTGVFFIVVTLQLSHHMRDLRWAHTALVALIACCQWPKWWLMMQSINGAIVRIRHWLEPRILRRRKLHLSDGVLFAPFCILPSVLFGILLWSTQNLKTLIFLLQKVSPSILFSLISAGFLLRASVHQLISVRNNWPFISSPIQYFN